jgi:hypothetical protein
MQYLILAYESTEDFDARTDPERSAAYVGAWGGYVSAVHATGAVSAGGGLEAPGTGTTLRLRDGERHVQDGPFADTKEQLGGFLVIDVPDLDAALEWAARCPAAATGAVEVRPMLPPMGA